MIIIDKAIYHLFRSLAKIVISLAQDEIIGTDLVYTKTLLNSLEAKMLREIDAATIDFYMEDYGIKIDRGYSAEDAKKRASGALGLQEYLDDLVDWYENKLGADPEEAKVNAIKTLKKHLSIGYESQRSAGGKGFMQVVIQDEAMMKKVLENDSVMTYALYKHFLSLKMPHIEVTLPQNSAPTPLEFIPF